MKNILFFTDIHLEKNSLEECQLIFNEIIERCNEYNIDTVMDIGDTFDSISPGSDEMDLFADFVKKLNRKLIVIVAQSHESTTPEDSVLNHYGILDNNIEIYKEFIDENRLFCGHFLIQEGKVNYGAKISKEQLKQYKQIWLGHQHTPQVIDNICYLGSSRFISFDEVNDKKQIAIIQNYKKDTEKTLFLSILSCFPMVVVSMSKKNTIVQPAHTVLKNRAEIEVYLNNLDPKTKVKIKIEDFETYKWFISLENKYKTKFVKYIRENKFEIISEISTSKKQENISLKESFSNYCKEKKIDKEIKEIIEKELK